MVITVGQPLDVLYVFKASGCGACEAAMPHLDAWRRARGFRTTVVQLNVGLKDWSIAGFTPEATPTYLITRNGQPVAQYAGMMTAEELELWFTTALAGNPVEPVRETEATEDDEEQPAKRKPRSRKKRG